MKKNKSLSKHHAHNFPRFDFDQYKDRYQSEVQKSISFIGQSHDFFTRMKALHLSGIIRRHFGGKTGLKVLDVGCGVGVTEQYLKEDYQKLYGVDIGKGMIQKARNLNPEVAYKVTNGKKLPFRSGTMDVAFAICVLHHIPPANLGGFIDEMKRVTRKGGLVVVFEHNPLNPLTLHAVNHCDLDAGAILIRMGKTLELFLKHRIGLVDKNYIFFTPFKGGVFQALDRLLGWLPMGAQYYVVGKK